MSVLVLLALDQVAVRVALERGAFGGRPVPPFAERLTPVQEEWLTFVSTPIEQRENTIFRIDEELGWCNAALGVASGGRDSTSSRGFRGRREYADSKPAGFFRIVCAGDSFIWGADVADDESVPAYLEQLHPDVEAPNLGVSAYGTDQALLRLRRDGFALDADAVLLGVMLENIGRNVNRYRPLWFPGSTACSVKPRFVLDADGLLLIPSPYGTAAELAGAVRDGSVLEATSAHEYWAKRPLWGRLAFSPTARLVGSFVAERERQVRGMWKDRDGEPFRVTKAILEAFQQEATAAAVPKSLVVLFPSRYALHGLFDGRGRYWQAAVDELEEAGLHVLDVTDVLLAEQDRQRAQGERAPIFTRNNHLRPAYNEAVARAVLFELGLAGADDR